ncbi:hypothetical protein PXNS11_230141 [Stutzerimonas xanthomarina]|nr:hypothetical protein PXNS11_230141 [Stutzerimonas xanthomarina]
MTPNLLIHDQSLWMTEVNMPAPMTTREITIKKIRDASGFTKGSSKWLSGFRFLANTEQSFGF